MKNNPCENMKSTCLASAPASQQGNRILKAKKQCAVRENAGGIDTILPGVGLLRGFRRNMVIALFLPVTLFGSGCANMIDQLIVPANESGLLPASTDRFSNSVYAGAGIGISRLEPDTSQVGGWDSNDRVNNGGQVTIGVDLLKQISAELHSADLGSAGLSPSGRINYHINGVSALIYAGGNRDQFLRRGVNAYGRFGYGALHNSPVGDVPFETVNANHILIGAGIEYMTRSGLGVRAELISFDKDISFGQLGMVYRLGQKRKAVARIVEVAPEPVQAAALPVEKVAYAPPPPPPPIILPNPCARFKGVLEGVNFHTDSAQLTGPATVVLDGVAQTLAECVEVPLVVSAHTDSVGDAEYNQELSERRATSVLNYLGSRGIDTTRLSPMSFGESEPVDSNDTSEGRRRNRRVELIAK